MKILLFDMDGVLIEPRAYHQALSETVTMMGYALGYRDVNLTREDIEVFESVGVTSEWDSAAICSALLLRRVWKVFSEITLPPAPPLPELPQHDMPIPDFQSFFRSQAMEDTTGMPALSRAEYALLADCQTLTETQVIALRDLLRGARRIDRSLTHHIFQELVLGSQVFHTIYSLEPFQVTKSYLLTYDRPALSQETRDQLLAWSAQPDHTSVVFTNRPSQSPPGFFGTPEAELGMKMLGLEKLPFVGRGCLAWLAEAREVDPDTLLKPSAVHSLTALRRALDDPLEEALDLSIALVLDKETDSSWQALREATVYVFEDSIKGLRSALAAQEALSLAGVTIQLHLVGVSTSPTKRLALEIAGAQVFSDITSALHTLFQSN